MSPSPADPVRRSTYALPEDLFRAVYDSPSSLPGRFSWVTPDDDVREIERLLGIPDQSIGAPLWLSGDRRDCPSCERMTSWLDIVSSALGEVHRKELLVRVILGVQQYVNLEAPDAVPGVHCNKCGAAIEGLRSFKCHNWAYAFEDIDEMVRIAVADT
jgi:hypothetical protein